MKARCQKCGEMVAVNGLGRKPLAIPVTIVCDTLKACSSVNAAAEKLNCSRAYIYKVLKANGLSLGDVREGIKPLREVKIKKGVNNFSYD